MVLHGGGRGVSPEAEHRHERNIEIHYAERADGSAQGGAQPCDVPPLGQRQVVWPVRGDPGEVVVVPV